METADRQPKDRTSNKMTVDGGLFQPGQLEVHGGGLSSSGQPTVDIIIKKNCKSSVISPKHLALHVKSILMMPIRTDHIFYLRKKRALYGRKLQNASAARARF